MNKSEPIISVIIPHKNNHPLLLSNLQRYERQTLRDDLYEIIVIDDHSDQYFKDWLQGGDRQLPRAVRVGQNKRTPGPAGARNTGADAARGDILLFVGDDCVPDANLLWQHILSHKMYSCAVQGYTPFHPGVMDTYFMHWLDTAGLQAAWANCREGEGWKEYVDGYLLTTNWSIQKREFYNYNGFPEVFPDAAWEDVALGHTLLKGAYRTVFNPRAINFHYHKHNILSFFERQKKEGRSRPIICTIHPELSANLMSPEVIRQSDQIVAEELFYLAEQLSFAPQVESVKAEKEKIWGDLMTLGSVLGLKESLNKEYSPWMALRHVHDGETVAYIASVVKAIQESNHGFAMHCIQWATTETPDNWAVYGLAGEIHLAFNEHNKAKQCFERAYILGPGEKWIEDRLKELNNE